jgi:hypothetical protein
MTRPLIRTVAVALAATAFAAPTALARPLDAPTVAKAPDTARQQDLRHLRAGGTNVGATRPLPGAPTWPVNPQPIKSAPAVHISDTGGGRNWTTIEFGIAGSLLILGGIVGIHSRRLGRAHIAA